MAWKESAGYVLKSGNKDPPFFTVEKRELKLKSGPLQRKCNYTLSIIPPPPTLKLPTAQLGPWK